VHHSDHIYKFSLLARASKTLHPAFDSLFALPGPRCEPLRIRHVCEDLKV
jgi:hypothetical protein